MGSAAREMTLEEWVAKLHPSHSAVREYERLRAESAGAQVRADAAEAEVAELRAQLAEAGGNLKRMQTKWDGLEQTATDQANLARDQKARAEKAEALLEREQIANRGHVALLDESQDLLREVRVHPGQRRSGDPRYRISADVFGDFDQRRQAALGEGS